MKIKTILCDMGGVLIEWNPKKLIANHILDMEDRQHVYETIFNTNFWIRSDWGEITDEQKIKEMYTLLPRRLHAPVEKIMDWPMHVDIHYDMFDCLREIKPDYRLILLSNVGNFFSKIEERVPAFNLFEEKVLSYREKIAKPDPEIFMRTLKRYNLKAQACLFIDDVLENVQSAERVGINGYHYDGNVAKLKQFLNEQRDKSI